MNFGRLQIRRIFLSFILSNVFMMALLHVKDRNDHRSFTSPRNLKMSRLWAILTGNTGNDHERLFEQAILRMLGSTNRANKGEAGPSNSSILQRIELDGFDQFFHQPKTVEFINRYHAACLRRIAEGNRKTFSFVFNSETRNGFGSIMNIALNVYLIAQDWNVDRCFNFIEIPWFHVHYTPLSHFFEDFAAKTPCPAFTKPTSRGSLVGPFFVGMNDSTNTVDMSGSDHAVIRYFGRGWKDIFDTTVTLVKRDGIGKIFAVKSELLRAIWKPKKLFKKLLKTLWRKANGVSEFGGYVGVHIRQGDKVALGEMTNISISNYVNALEKMRENVTTQQRNIRNVFVMHDEPAAFFQLQSQLLNSEHDFRVFQLSDLLRDVEFDGVREYILKGKRDTVNGGHGDPGAWQRHSRELILSLTLMAMADQVICTFSSNVCRLIALINGDLGIFQSLDRDWHPL